MTGQRHPYADHPAAHLLADHQFRFRFGPVGQVVPRGACACREWSGADYDHPAHLAEALHRAGLLADGTPPETPTARVLAERADRRTT